MHLDYLIYLSAEIIDNVEEAAVCADQNLTDFSSLLARLRILNQFECAHWIVEHLASSCIVQWDKLTWQEIALYFEEANIFFSATSQTIADDFAKLEANKFKIA